MGLVSNVFNALRAEIPPPREIRQEVADERDLAIWEFEQTKKEVCRLRDLKHHLKEINLKHVNRMISLLDWFMQKGYENYKVEGTSERDIKLKDKVCRNMYRWLNAYADEISKDFKKIEEAESMLSRVDDLSKKLASGLKRKRDWTATGDVIAELDTGSDLLSELRTLLRTIRDKIDETAHSKGGFFRKSDMDRFEAWTKLPSLGPMSLGRLIGSSEVSVLLAKYFNNDHEFKGHMADINYIYGHLNAGYDDLINGIKMINDSITKLIRLNNSLIIHLKRIQ